MITRQETLVNRLLTLTLVLLLGLSLAAQAQILEAPNLTNNPLAMFIITNLLAEPQPELSVPLFSLTNTGPWGNYWRFQGPALPLPLDPFPELLVYEIGTNQYLIDDRSVNYQALNSLLEAQAEAEGWTNPPATISLMNTNGLWINVPTNSLAVPDYFSANLMNTLQGQSYDILTTPDLLASWATALTVTGAVGNVTPVQVPMNNCTNLFVGARTSPDYSFYLVTEPLSQAVCGGDTVTFSVATGGNTNLTFQWTCNGVAIPGATNSSYSLSGLLDPAAGNYYACIISDGTNSLITAAAQLTTAWPGNDQGLTYLLGNRQDYTFKSGVTYYIGWPIQLYGNTTIEAGAVLKFDWYSKASLQIMGTLTCKGEPYYPAMLTSVDDDSVGEALLDPSNYQYFFSDEDGPPQPYPTGVPYLEMAYATSNSISNLRIRYADWGVTTPVLSGTLYVWDCQFVQCNYGIVNLVAAAGAKDSLHNVLFSQCGAAIGASTNVINVDAEQVTADVGTFCLANSTPDTIALTNSIVLGNSVTASTVATVNVVFNPDPTNFQPTGAGNYYLAPTSPLHSAGTATISPRLQSELQGKTTYPPVVIADFTTNSGSMTLAPQAPRYVGGAPDLGWYYDALDYTVANMVLNGGALAVLPGTAIGYRMETNSAGNWTFIGFDVQANSSFISQGTPNHPNVFVDVQQVQEQFAWPIWAGIVPDYFPTDPSSQPPVLNFRFSKFRLNYVSYQQTPAFHFFSGIDAATGNEWSYDSAMYLTLQDCDLRGGQVSLGQPDWYSYDLSSFWGTGMVSWTNNSFDNVAINLDPSYSGYTNVDLAFSAYNNLFRRGLWFHLEPIPASAGNWVLNDNLFDQVNIVQDTAAPLNFSNNGYWPLSTNGLTLDAFFYPWQWIPNSAKLQPTATSDGSHEVTLGSAPPYQASPFGNFYLPTNTALYGAGSRTPANAGLYHYTTRLDQVKEGNEAAGHNVNIGVHYVAVNNSGVPMDSDGDQIPDYVENRHGDGAYGNHTDTETDWQNAYTVTGVYDPTNSLYDDVDLSGDGLVGRIKKALGMQPFDPSNPLALSQVITGEEPDFATFEVPVPYDAVTASGTLNLNMNGIPVTLAECSPATNGNCLLSFNVDFDPAGLHYLSAGFKVGTDPALDNPVRTASGPVQPFCSSNSLQFYVNGSMFDAAGAYLDAKLFVPEADYTIDLYDVSTTPRTWILSITNSTSSGMIQEDWGATNADGTTFTGTTVQAVFSVTPSGASSPVPGSPTKNFTRAAGALSEDGPNFDLAYMYTPTNSALAAAFGNINGIQGAVWLGMQGVADALLTPPESSGGRENHYYSSFNRYTSQDFPGQLGFPGYVTSRAAITNTLLPDLTNGLTRAFYCYAHGSSNTLQSWDGTTWLGAGEVGRGLGNSYTKTNLITQKPCRFVFLDGCATASTMDWCRAFGIYPLNGAPRDKVGPQAYVGWAKDHDAWMNGNTENDNTKALNIAKAYTRTLFNFYLDWMSETPLKVCIDNASNYGRFGAVQLPIWGNGIIRIYGDGYDYTDSHVLTSRVYIIGHPGLTRSGFNPNLKNDKTYAPPAN